MRLLKPEKYVNIEVQLQGLDECSLNEFGDKFRLGANVNESNDR